MKIVFVCDTLGSGGAERVISTLTNEFFKFGHSVDIIMLSKEADKPFYELDSKTGITYLLKNREDNPGFTKKAKLLKKTIIDKNPDVVISFYHMFAYTLGGRFAKQTFHILFLKEMIHIQEEKLNNIC